jgi:hypothetical protein
MKHLLYLFVFGIIIIQCCLAVDEYTRAIIKKLQDQLTTPTINDYFVKVGSLDPALSTVLMYGPNAAPDALICLAYNFKAAVETVRNNLGDVFSVVTYYQGKCNTDANLNKALEALADKDAQQRLRVVAQNIINGLPQEVASLATDAINQAFSNNAITVEQAEQFASRIRALSDETKQIIFAHIPSAQSVFNGDGPYNAPLNDLLNNFAVLLKAQEPTDEQKASVNAALVQAFDYAHKNAVEFLDFVFGWLKGLPIDQNVANDQATIRAYNSGANKLVGAGKAALFLPPTQQTIENMFTDPYQI